MTSRLEALVIDGHDVPLLARFWRELLQRDVADPGDEGVLTLPSPDSHGFAIDLAPTDRSRTMSDRMHFDLRPYGAQDEEVARLEALGATRADIGQGDVGWVVMRDPDGNEFCVLSGQ